MLRNPTPVKPKAKICGIVISPEDDVGTGGQGVSLSPEVVSVVTSDLSIFTGVQCHMSVRAHQRMIRQFCIGCLLLLVLISYRLHLLELSVLDDFVY